MTILEEPNDTISEMTLAELRGEQVASEPSPEPELTEAIVRAVVADLIVVEESGGHHGIAQKHRITRGQVRRIDKLRMERIAELSEQAPAIEPKKVVATKAAPKSRKPKSSSVRKVLSKTFRRK